MLSARIVPFFTIELRPGRPATEKRNGEIQKMAGEGAGKNAAKIRGAGGSAGEGAAPHSFPRKAPLAAPSPALPSARRIFAALFPAPSPAIFWISPFLYSVAGRPGRNNRSREKLYTPPPPPPPPISGQKAFSRGGGWGCIF